MSDPELLDVVECDSCGRGHKLIHVMHQGGGRYYFCPATEDRVLLSIDPLEPEAA